MSDIARLLLPWFEQHGRKDLPWQQVHDPSGYHVWLSEIMLQQTQVKTVIPYFNRFVDAFPNFGELAHAPLDEVLNQWAGLGYYARARHLHSCARQVVDQFNGVLPTNLPQLMDLPGIGQSTAGAILSLAFGERAAILDGNVKRVLSRLFCVPGWPGQGATLKQLWRLAEQYTPGKRSAEYNQAMMDLGATLCKRASPDCGACPLRKMCQSFRAGEQALYPYKKPPRSRPHKCTWMLLHRYQDQLLLQRRPATGIWGGLWSLPELEQLDQLADWQLHQTGLTASVSDKHSALLKHQFSHYDLTISLAEVQVSKSFIHHSSQQVREEQCLRWVHWREIGDYGLPAPVCKILSMQMDSP